MENNNRKIYLLKREGEGVWYIFGSNIPGQVAVAATKDIVAIALTNKEATAFSEQLPILEWARGNSNFTTTTCVDIAASGSKQLLGIIRPRKDADPEVIENGTVEKILDLCKILEQ